jgi:hypothetical protein
MPERKKLLRRGEIIGHRVGGEPADEAEHFIKCPTCGNWIDMRDLAQVLEHEGPLPHPAQDRAQSVQVGRPAEGEWPEQTQRPPPKVDTIGMTQRIVTAERVEDVFA